MARKAELKAVLTLNNSLFLRTINYSIKVAKRFAAQLKANPVRTLGLAAVVGAEKALIGATAAVAAFKVATVAAYTIVGAKSIEAAAQIETVRVGFETLLGSAEKANGRIAQLKALSQSTPFNFEDIAGASRQLEILTEGALTGAKSMEMIGNVASGTQRQFDEVAMTVGRLYASLRAGLPIGDAILSLRDMGAITDHGARRAQRFAAAGTPQASAAAWKELTHEFARFDGQSTKMANTWSGMAIQFKNAVHLAFADFGDPLIKALGPTFRTIITELTNHKDDLKAMGEGFANSLKGAIDYVDDFFKRQKAAKEQGKGGLVKQLFEDIGEQVDKGIQFLKKPIPTVLTLPIQPTLRLAEWGVKKLAERSVRADYAKNGVSGSVGVGSGNIGGTGNFSPTNTRKLEELNTFGANRLKTTGLRQISSLGLSALNNFPSTNPLGEAARRTTPVLRFRERREIDNQVRAQEMAMRYGQGNLTGKAPGDTRVRRGDRARMMQVVRDQQKKEQEALTNKKFDEFMKKFDQFAKEMGGS